MALSQFSLGKAPTKPTAAVSSKPKLNILGQPIVAEPAKPASQAVPLAQRGITAGISRQNVENKAIMDSLDSPQSPRSKAARLMKRQAGIGQLKTMHVEEPEL